MEARIQSKEKDIKVASLLGGKQNIIQVHENTLSSQLYSLCRSHLYGSKWESTIRDWRKLSWLVDIILENESNERHCSHIVTANKTI
jgi:hypothetical protein